MPETIGERIRRERLALHFRQADLAEAVGVGVPYISQIESGHYSPTNALLEKLAPVLNVDPDELMLVARRLPEWAMDVLAADPAAAVQALRRWQTFSSG